MLVIGHILSLFLSRQMGHPTYSRMDAEGANMYFWLLLVNLYFVKITGDALVYTELGMWYRDPNTIGERFVVK
eukprot:14325107-Ditylum_brightwellii.AAC.1